MPFEVLIPLHLPQYERFLMLAFAAGILRMLMRYSKYRIEICNNDLRSNNLLMLLQTNTIRYGNVSLTFRGSILWNYLENEIKSKTSVCSFKKCIKSWSGEEYNCKICN